MKVRNNKHFLILLLFGIVIAFVFGFYFVVAAGNENYIYVEDTDGLDSGSEYAIVYASSEYNFLSKILYHDAGSTKTDQVEGNHLGNTIKLNTSNAAFTAEKQLWKVEGNDEDGWTIQSMSDNKYLNINGITTSTTKAPVTTTAQKLAVSKDSNNKYSISKTISDVKYYLYHEESATTQFYVSDKKAVVHFYKKVKKTASKFENFKKTIYKKDTDGLESNNNYMIVSFSGGNKILYHSGSSSTTDQVTGSINGGTLTPASYSISTQKWYIRGDEDKGYYIISNDGNLQYLNINGETTSSQRVPVGNTNQKFTITKNDDDTYYIYREIDGTKYYLSHADSAAVQFNVSKTPSKMYLYKEVQSTPELAKIKFKGTSVEQPFVSEDVKSDYFRIPSLITLSNGWILGGADSRWKVTADSPANLDTIVSLSKNAGLNWDWNVVNYFSDYSNSSNGVSSSSFIDSSMVEYKNKVIMAVDVVPSYVGLGSGNKTNNKSTGFDDQGRLIVAKAAASSSAPVNEEDYLYRVDYNAIPETYTVEDGEKDLYPIILASNNSKTGYYVDDKFDVYYTSGDDILPSYAIQSGSEDIIIKNLFYYQSEWKVYPCFFTGIRKGTITNDGIKWDSLKLVNVKNNEHEAFLGVAPGRGVTLKIDKDTTRIIFPVYDMSDNGEKASTIYSDDGGNTWNRGQRTTSLGITGKSSESQLIVLPDNTLRMYSRNSIGFISYTDSTDGGITWGTYKVDNDLSYTSNCMVSFINIDGKLISQDGTEYDNLIMASYPKDNSRTNGVIRIGSINEENEVTWLNQANVKYSGTYWYSSLTQLKNNGYYSSKIGLLYENTSGSIKYDSFNIEDLLEDDYKFVPSIPVIEKKDNDIRDVISDTSIISNKYNGSSIRVTSSSKEVNKQKATTKNRKSSVVIEDKTTGSSYEEENEAEDEKVVIDNKKDVIKKETKDSKKSFLGSIKYVILFIILIPVLLIIKNKISKKNLF